MRSLEDNTAIAQVDRDLERAKENVEDLNLSGRKHIECATSVSLSTQTSICLVFIIDIHNTSVDAIATNSTQKESNVERLALTFPSLTDEEMCDLGVASLPPTVPATQSFPPSTHSLVFVNLDFFVQTHHQSHSRTNTSLHWVHNITVEDRVPTYRLKKEKPIQAIHTI